MENLLTEYIPENELKSFREFTFILSKQCEKLLRNSDLLGLLEQYFNEHHQGKKEMQKTELYHFFAKTVELLIDEEMIVLLYRYKIARYRVLKVAKGGDMIEEGSIDGYLHDKDVYILGKNIDPDPLQLDFLPFYDYSPEIKSPRLIGNGMRFLNSHLSSSFFQDPAKWNSQLFNFMKIHKLGLDHLLINPVMFKDFDHFFKELEKTMSILEKKDKKTPSSEVETELKKRGFEIGWGGDVERILQTMNLLVDLVNEPRPELLEDFITRIPMVQRVAILSPHGWFGQKKVLGRPDTGGQVIYILDQVRALEQQMSLNFKNAGISIKPKILVVTRLIPEAEETSCDQRLEKIFGTENSWILRVPFKDKHEQVVPHWISRFAIWPYLDRFADDVEIELLSEFEGRPDLLIGNYSDGNLVATILSDKMDVIQCNIAHALEKTKYTSSDIQWQNMEQNYNFSLQFTADLLAMNKSNFIITSTYQEIAGTENSIGQYESYQFFTMPGLFRVKSGINLFHPKFNVIPPGVDESNYFPYNDKSLRLPEKQNYLREYLLERQVKYIHGNLKDSSKPIIFSMARLDKVKNLTSLVEAYGQSDYLKKKCNLVIAGGTISLEESKDNEEKEVITRLYQLYDQYQLHGHMRWLPAIEKQDTGEIYRLVADLGGIFVQPALFEAFGLTVLEAMLCGLPTFATSEGGPAEIIIDEESGFLLNTSTPELIARRLEEFFKLTEKKKNYWQEISSGGIKRVRENFTWRRYSSRLITLTNLYGFWRYSVSGQGKVKMSRYCDLIHHLLFSQRAQKLEN